MSLVIPDTEKEKAASLLSYGLQRLIKSGVFTVVCYTLDDYIVYP
jgi:hypothetical protein